MKVDAKFYAALFLALSVTALQNAVISQHRAVLGQYVILQSAAHDGQVMAVEGWERAVSGMEQWQLVAAGFEAQVNRCIADAGGQRR